ncbi:MAG: dockerin type I domain-containing protein, partial [Bacteroidales bacterium]
PSVSQSFDLTGSNLTGAPGNLTVDAGTSNYEVSSDNINFGVTASVPFSSATLTATPVYLRLKAGLAIGNYYGELIGVTGGGVITSVNVTCSGTVLAPEPTNHAASFGGNSSNYSSIVSTWSDNDGTQEASGFLLLANKTGIFIDPIDGTDPADDAALADGSGSVHMLHGVQTYTWTNLDAGTEYFFKIYAYTNSGTDINFKTIPVAPSATISTQAYVPPLAAWTFDATAAAPNTPTSVAANYGSQSATAMLYANGSNGSSLWIADTTGKELNAFTGSTINDPRQGLAFAGMSYCPVGGIANLSNGKSMILKFSMAGYENPILTYAARHSSTAGFNSHLWAYSTDGVNFTDFGSNLAPISTTFTTKTLDLSTVNVLDQASTVYLKVTFNGATTSTSNNRLDNIVINATAAVPSTKTLNLTAYLESLFNSGTGKMNQAQKSGAPQFGDGIADQITVELHNNTAPFATAYTYSGIDLNTNGTVTISTIPAEVSGSYYVVLKHRNSVELWSATAVSFAGITIDYNFSTSASQAYGNAMKDLGSGVFGMYAGDVNQDGIVDSGDMVVVDNDAANFVTGYVANDVNGDGTINAADLLLLNANATGFVGKKMP